MTETLLQMELRHAKERATLVERLQEEAYTAGLHDRMKPGSTATPRGQMELITEKVAAQYKFLPSELRGPARFAKFVQPRREIWSELRERGYSLTHIARYFGRDHTTILEGIQKHKSQKEAQ